MTAGVVDHWWTASDGVGLYAGIRGAGRADAAAVLCLPGLTRNGRDFEDLAPVLAATRMVLTPDFRGRGRSERDPSGDSYQPQVYASDMVALLDSLGLERVHCVGTSLGGMVAEVLAALVPDRVLSIVLNDVGPELAPAGLARIRGYAGKLPSVSSWDEARDAVRGTISDVLPGLTDDEWAVITRRLYRQDASGPIGPDYDPAIAAGLHATDVSAAPSAWPLYEAIRDRPMLLLRGALSDLLTPATVERMRELKPDLQVVEVPDRGHTPTLDEPVSRAAITQFLNGLP